MNSFVDYIEESCAGLRDDKILYNYKRMLYDEITERANQITASGLKDEKVLGDLIRDEYPNIKENYKSYYDAKTKKLREKRRIKLTAIGSVFTFIIMFIAYFGVSFSTHRWSNSWLIIVGGIFGLIILWLSFAIKKLCTMKKIFHPVARILTAICIMMVTVFVCAGFPSYGKSVDDCFNGYYCHVHCRRRVCNSYKTEIIYNQLFPVYSFNFHNAVCNSRRIFGCFVALGLAAYNSRTYH